MATTVQVVRTCDRCEKVVESKESKGLKPGDAVPTGESETFKIVTRTGSDGEEKVVVSYTDLCPKCTEVVNNYVGLITKARGDETAPGPTGEKRVGRKPRSAPEDSPGPEKAAPEATASAPAAPKPAAPAAPEATFPDESKAEDPF